MAKVAEIKTKPSGSSVDQFIARIQDEEKRKDCQAILEMMEKATGEKGQVWGESMIGFGNLRYKSPATGREVDWFIIGFAPRKANISLYLTMDVSKHAETLEKLGKHKTGKGCLYINKLGDVDVKVLEKLIATAGAKKIK